MSWYNVLEQPPEQQDRPVIPISVSGLAIACGLGDETNTVWTAVKRGDSGITPIRRLDVSSLRSRFAAELQSDPAGPDRAVGLGVRVATAAVVDAGVDLADLDSTRVGVALGTSVGGLERGEQWQRDLLYEGVERTRRGLLLTYPLYTAADAISGVLGLRGPKVVISNACAAGANAIGWAADQIRLGRADLMVAGGVDVLDMLSLAGFESLKALDDQPCAPLSRSSGLNLGEGAGFVILESQESLRRRAGTAVAWFHGYGLSSDAHHATAPDPQGGGALRAMRRALAAGHAEPSQVGYLNAHGTGTPANDSAEPRAITALFDPCIPPVSSTKSQIGHTLGAAGAVEAVVTVLALRDKVLPPTINVQERSAGPRPLPDIVEKFARPTAIDLVLSNSFAFGGNNCALLFGAAAPTRSTGPGRRQVVITGAGAITGLGIGRAALTDAVDQGRSAIGQAQRLQLTHSRSQAVAELTGEHLALVDRSYLRRVDQLGALVLAVARTSLKDAEVNVRRVGRERVGMVFGTFTGPLETVSELSRVITKEGPDQVSPRLFPNSVVNAAVGHACLSTQVKGPLSTLATGVAAGVQSIQYSADLIADGEASIMLALTADEITPELHLGYDRLGLLGSADSTPYAADTTGLVPGAGAAALVLEELHHALDRGATIYGEVLGQSNTADAGPIGGIDPEGEAWARGLALALERSDIAAEDLAAVYGDARGTEVLDRAELGAVLQALPGGATLANIGSMTGHLGATTAVASAVTALRTLATGWVPSVRGSPSTPSLLNLSGRRASDDAPRHALVTSANWGGTYASVVLGPVRT